MYFKSFYYNILQKHYFCPLFCTLGIHIYVYEDIVFWIYF
ncbi:hypothetical protein X975_03286, partial [Stegodyphus mimosarum]